MRNENINLELLVFIVLIALCLCSVPACMSKNYIDAEKKTNQKDIRLEGQPNFRDLGGYKTLDGKTVKSRMIYRSGELARLNNNDLALIESLGIKTVVNFLTEDEIKARGKDRLPSGIKEFSLPISGDAEQDLAKVVLAARRTGDFSTVPVELNYEVHKLLVGDASRNQYAELLRLASDPANLPLVFHCSHGVHRTGTASAILLSSLGVSWETIRGDYLLSNDYRKNEIEIRLEQLRYKAADHQGVTPDLVDMTNINAFYILKGSYIDATLNQILNEYGSIEGYLTNGLGLNNSDLDNLKGNLLKK